MDRIRDEFAVSDTVAPQLVGDQSPGLTSLTFQQLAEEAFGRTPITTWLDEDVDHVTVLVHGSPQILLAAPESDEHLVQISGVTLAAAPEPQPPGVVEPERPAPLPDRLIRDGDPALDQQILDIPKADTESVVEPDCVTNDFARIAVPVIEGSGGFHDASLAAMGPS